MSLASGTRVGAYEIVELVGAGGMGEVYRARDARLKRDVAIKALPPHAALDTESAARFRREAEALAALNHPHIASIYDLVESDGAQFLVLELVDGDTIAERANQGPIPIREALGIARQIAEALEAAHARGIVHRDLKPANVKVTPDGRVKVLDFGLAKDLGTDAAHSAAPGMSHSPTIVATGTMAGVILGTAAYMSPEQARGQRVDAQADIWALGCVLFEMLARRRPFTGATVTDILAAVVRAEPDWSALPPDTPVGARRVLRRMLQKDCALRLHHVADARIEIEEAQADPSSTAVPATRGGRARGPWIAAVAMGAIAIGLGIALAWALRSVPIAPEMRVEMTTPTSSDLLFMAISPDGRTLVFVADTDGVSRLWVRSLDGSAARPLKGTERSVAPFWSPDSRSIGFFSEGKLRRIDLLGGLTQDLANAPIGAGGAWNRDGTILYAPSVVGGLFRVRAAGGDPVAVTRMVQTATVSHRYPQFLPDGNHFLFYITLSSAERGVYLGSLDGAEPRRLLDADSAAVLTSNRHLLFVRQGTLFAQAFDPIRRELGGEPFVVADGIAGDTAQGLAAVSASMTGPLAYRTGGGSGTRQLVWVDRSGKPVSTLGGSDTSSLFNPELSADGRFVAVNRSVEANTDIWQVETARGVSRRFTFDAATDQLAVWSPDGQRIVFSSNRKGTYDLYEKPASGPGGEQLLLASAENKFPMGFSPDGRHLLYRNTGPNTDWDLWALPLAADRKPFPVVQTKFQEMIGEFSPDGRWIAYQTTESGQFEVFVQSFPEPGAREQISTGGGSQPRWRPDGKELFYVGLDSRMMAAPIGTDAKRQLLPAAPVPLFVVRSAGGPVPSPQKQQYAVSRDGKQFLVNRLTEEAATSPITLVLNWKPPAAK